MDLRQMLYFVTVVECGNISAAAKALNLSQPPLSRQIQLLEEEMGAQLLVRGPRQVTRTEAGKIFYNKAKNILALAEDTRQELRDVAAGQRGRISLGVISSSGNTGSTRLLRAFHRDHPQVRFRVLDRSSFELIELVRNGVVDLAVVRGPIHQSQMEGLNFYRLLEEPLAVVGQAHYFENLPAGPLSLRDVEHLPLLLPFRAEALWDEFDKASRLSREVATFEDTRTAALWAKAGIGVALLPRSVGELYGAGLALRPLRGKRMSSAVMAIWRDKAPLSLSAQILLEYLVKHAKERSKPYDSGITTTDEVDPGKR